MRTCAADLAEGAGVGPIDIGLPLRTLFSSARLKREASLLLGREACLGGVVVPTATEGIEVPPGRLAAMLSLSVSRDGACTVVEIEADSGHDPVPVALPVGAVVWVAGACSGAWPSDGESGPVVVAAYGPVDVASPGSGCRELQQTSS